nr:hypothetical protein [Tanacetum cinerariifolium]
PEPIMIIHFRPEGLVNLLYMIKSPSLVCLLRVMLLRAVDIAKLKLCSLSVLPSSSAVTYAFATLPYIGRDVILKSSELSPEHYATLVAYSAPFHKYPKPFLCLVGMGQMDLLSFIRTIDPSKVRIGKRQRGEDEPKLLETTVGRVVSLLPVSPDHSFGELEASVEKIFVADASEPSHPAKKLRDDYGAPDGPTVGGKSQSLIQRLLGLCKSLRISMPIIMIATTSTPTTDPAAIAKEKLVGSSVFGADSPSASRSQPIPGGFSDCSGSDFLIGDIQTVIDPDSNLQKVYIPQWSVTNGMDHDQLFIKFNVEAACQICLSAEVRMHVEYNIKERMRLNSVVEEKDSLLKSRCEEIESLKAQLLVLKERNATLEKEKSELEIQVTDLVALVKVRTKKLQIAVVTSMKLQNDSLVDKVHKLEASSARHQEKVTVYENCTSQLDKFQDKKWRPLRRVSKKGYLSILPMSVNFSLTAKLKANKHASFETIMNLLHLEDALAKKLGLVESQPHVDQLMVPIHHSPDQRVIGASALSLSLDVSSSWVRKIKENIANHVSALRGVFVPLSEPLSAMDLEGTEGTFDALNTTTALSVTSVSASTIPPISTDDNEVVHTDGQEGTGVGGGTVADESVVPFPNVSNAELDVLE